MRTEDVDGEEGIKEGIRGRRASVRQVCYDGVQNSIRGNLGAHTLFC